MKVDTEAMVVLEECRVEGNKLFLPAQLDRALYTKVNKVLDAMGGKWNRGAKAHVFGEDPSELLEQVYLTGEITSLKQELQYFATPDMVAHRLVDLAELKAGDVVLEPSAGEGAIAKKLKAAGCKVSVCEKHEPFRDKLSAEGLTVLPETDFLMVNSNGWKAIVANPPFTKQQDVDHVSHMLDLVSSGGRVVSIMSNGITFRQSKKTQALREKLSKGFDWELIELEEGSFKSSGTMVNTVILVASRR